MFKSYVNVDFDLPEDFYEWEEDEQEKFWTTIYAAQEQAEEEYVNTIRMLLNRLVGEIEFDVESK